LNWHRHRTSTATRRLPAQASYLRQALPTESPRHVWSTPSRDQLRSPRPQRYRAPFSYARPRPGDARRVDALPPVFVQVAWGHAAPLPATPAVVADLVHRHVVDDRLVVYVCDGGVRYVCDAAIVEIGTVIPMTSFEPNAPVAESIVDATIESDLGRPITGVPDEGGARPSPNTLVSTID